METAEWTLSGSRQDIPPATWLTDLAQSSEESSSGFCLFQLFSLWPGTSQQLHESSSEVLISANGQCFHFSQQLDCKQSSLWESGTFVNFLGSHTSSPKSVLEVLLPEEYYNEKTGASSFFMAISFCPYYEAWTFAAELRDVGKFKAIFPATFVLRSSSKVCLPSRFFVHKKLTFCLLQRGKYNASTAVHYSAIALFHTNCCHFSPRLWNIVSFSHLVSYTLCWKLPI